MINELFSLAKALDSKGISSTEWHRKYKTLPKVTPKAPCVRIWLNENGAICDFEGLSTVHAAELRKYGDNQSSFPAFNISPLYRLTSVAYIEELENIEAGKSKADIEKIRSWCHENNWIKGAPKQVQRSLTDCQKEFIGKLGTQSKIMVIEKLAELCRKLCTEIPGGFRGALEKCIYEKLEKGDDTSLALTMLFHKGNKEKEHNIDVGNKISVILDVYSWQQYGYPVATEQVTYQLNKLLLASSKTDIALESDETDALGAPFTNPGEPMPGVKLSGFDVVLRSMFSGQPCQYRYKQIDDGSYPISAENRAAIKKSLEWMAAPEHRQITWEKIDKNEIVFIYPSTLPEVPPKFASIFGNSSSKAPDKTEARFESMAQEFTKTFQGLPAGQKPDVMQIFTIKKIDKARSKVIFTHNTTPDQLIRAADYWKDGCQNLPPLDIGEIITPFPLEIADIINAVWKQSGERADGKAPVRRMKYHQGMELLLDILPQRAVHHFLHIMLENYSGLIHYLGNYIHADKTRNKRDAVNQMKAAARMYSVLGLLLYQCEERRERYMEELAYLIGQLLHVSDELHTLYCKIKRDGDIPPQLAGGALFVTAGEMPYQALSQLSTRMNPYLSWATQYRYRDVNATGAESWRAGWLLRLFRQLSDKISPQMDKAVHFGDFERAKLFIGYMASLPKYESKGAAACTDNNIMGGIENE